MTATECWPAGGLAFDVCVDCWWQRVIEPGWVMHVELNACPRCGGRVRFVEPGAPVPDDRPRLHLVRQMALPLEVS
jgi:DNA-directed RNA polymerase subunit RPC12/RpoP